LIDGIFPSLPSIKKTKQALPCLCAQQVKMRAYFFSRIESGMRTQPNIKVLGVALTAPSTAGLLRMLGFLLLVVTAVEITDLMTRSAWSSEGSVALIVGAFSGFLLTECGASYTGTAGAHCAAGRLQQLVFAAASLVI
jgi:hypothetical protein